MCAKVCMWISEDNLQESVLFFHHESWGSNSGHQGLVASTFNHFPAQANLRNQHVIYWQLYSDPFWDPLSLVHYFITLIYHSPLKSLCTAPFICQSPHYAFSSVATIPPNPLILPINVDISPLVTQSIII